MTQLEIALPTKEQIEKRAYELYLARGCEPGKAVDDWLSAERELMLENELAEAVPPTKKQTRRAVESKAYSS